MKNGKELSEKNKQIELLKAENSALKSKLKSYEQYIAENQAMRSEQVVAEQIQKSMLPSSYPAFGEFPHIDLYADMDAACEVGGDFYDFYKINDDHICFSIADVEGKGIGAAMHMAITKSIIKLRIQSGEELADVYNAVNKQLCISSIKKRFVSSWAAVLNVHTGEMNCLNAGHNYPLLLRKSGEAEFIKNTSGIPLASYYSKKREFSYKSFDVKLEEGDVLILYTDGVTEAANRREELFGNKRLIDAVKLYMSENHTMKELTSYIRRRVISFMNHAGQDDDITLLAVRYGKPT